MVQVSGRRTALRGFFGGVVAGIALVALMYLANMLLGLHPLPQQLSGPLLAIMPGFVFGFLIDTLQHAGKVVEEFGLIVAMIIGLGVLGAAWAWTFRRWHGQYLALAFAALGWVVVAGVLLPVSGDGLLGLNEGFATPLIWAALFAIYGVVLQAGGDPTRAVEGVDAGRRRFLGAVPLTIGAVGLGVLALRLLPNWYQSIVNAPGAALNGVSPALTPIDSFYVVSKNFSDPVVDGSSWKLSIGGAVSQPMKASLTDLRALPAVNEYVTLECISNPVGGPQISTGAFTGVSLRDLLAMAGPMPGGTWAAFTSRDGYTESLPMSTIQAAPEILVVYDLDGMPLPVEHGFPARILIPGHYGMKSPKWLDRIDLVSHEAGGYWEQQGWDHNALVRTMSRFDMPRDSDIVKIGPVSVAGVSFAGLRGIGKVEYSTDGGRSWTAALTAPPLSPLTWVLWSATWTPSTEGSYQLKVRATDGTGALQESRGAPSYPDGSRGYHTIQVNIAKS
jgi:DMSO/TMAO reductase YedYZ molybdopterin-dependent catalytic subunit/uncharacterized membrane protein YhaH (DUF805 family)